jgi:hypothetical protein
VCVCVYCVYACACACTLAGWLVFALHFCAARPRSRGCSALQLVITPHIRFFGVSSIQWNAYVGNGYVATRIGSGGLFVGGIFNGVQHKTPSHRALLPSPLDLLVSDSGMWKLPTPSIAGTCWVASQKVSSHEGMA